MRRRTGPLLLLLALAPFPGCGGGPGGLVKGMGEVTLDGDPVGGADIVFLPTTGDGLLAVARTDEYGRFRLSTNDWPGVRPGRYKVSVGKQESLAVDQPARTTKKTEEDFPAAKKMQSTAASRNLLPEVYLVATTSPLEVEVPAEGNTKIELQLTKAAK